MAEIERRLTEREARFALALIPEVGSATCYRLVQALGSAEAVLGATV